MARHDLDIVGAKLQEVTRSYVERQLARILDDAELRISRQLASEGKPSLATERFRLAILDYEARVTDLEAAKEIQRATEQQFAEHARQWEKDFPGGSPPTTWSISRP